MPTSVNCIGLQAIGKPTCISSERCSASQPSEPRRHCSCASSAQRSRAHLLNLGIDSQRLKLSQPTAPHQPLAAAAGLQRLAGLLRADRKVFSRCHVMIVTPVNRVPGMTLSGARQAGAGRRQGHPPRGNMKFLAFVTALFLAASASLFIGVKVGERKQLQRSIRAAAAAQLPPPRCAEVLANATSAVAPGRPQKPEQVMQQAALRKLTSPACTLRMQAEPVHCTFPNNAPQLAMAFSLQTCQPAQIQSKGCLRMHREFKLPGNTLAECMYLAQLQPEIVTRYLTCNCLHRLMT